MKKRKFDYKVKKNSEQSSNRRSIKKQKPPRSNNTGLLIIIVAFIALTIASYYILSSSNSNIPNDKAEKFVSGNFLLVNDSGDLENPLHSVILLSYHSYENTKLITMAYFPPECSLDKLKSLNEYYKQSGPKSILSQFSEFFNDLEFYYFKVNKNFFLNTLTPFRDIRVYFDTRSRPQSLILPDSFFKEKKPSKFLYTIAGERLIKYLRFGKKTKSIASIKANRNRLLYVLQKFFSSKKGSSSRLRSLFNKGFGENNIPNKMINTFMNIFTQLKQSDILIVPFAFQKNQNIFDIKNQPQAYIHFLNYINTQLERNSFLTAHDYSNALKPMIRENIKNIKIKIIDRSGRGFQYASNTFQSYFKTLKIDIVSYDEKTLPNIEESYLVNASHRLEVLNIAHKFLKDVKYVYNSAHKPNDAYDIILVMGKDFPEFKSK